MDGMRTSTNSAVSTGLGLSVLTLAALLPACRVEGAIGSVGTKARGDAADGHGERDVIVLPLQNAKADELADVLRDVFEPEYSDGTVPPRIVADARTNSLVVLGTKRERERVAALVESLDRRLP